MSLKIEIKSIAIADNGQVFTTEQTGDQIIEFHADLDLYGRNCPLRGSRGGPLKTPAGLAIHADHMFVSDSGNHRVCMYSTKTYELVRCFGSGKGSEDGQLDHPLGLTTRGDLLYVADYNNHRVAVFYIGNGSFMFNIGQRAENLSSLLSGPTSVAVSETGDVYVVDTTKVVTMLDGDGTFIRSITHNGLGDSDLFGTPSSVAVFKDRLFVTDVVKHTVSMHRLDGTYTGKFKNARVLPKEEHIDDEDHATCCPNTRIHEPIHIAVGKGVAYVLSANSTTVQVFK